MRSRECPALSCCPLWGCPRMIRMRIRIGDLLVKAGVITDLQLKAALAEQSQWGGKLGDILVRMEFITEEVLVRALKDEGRTLVVAMSDPGNVMITDHLRSLTGCRIEAQLAGASAIRAAIARWYRGEELAGDESSMKIVNNSGDSVVTVDPKKAQPPPAAAQEAKAARTSALEVLRGVEETQRRSVAALKAMVELLIEKGVFSREEYLSRVKR